jgi:hypothetical protein
MSNKTETSRRVILQTGLGVIAAAAVVSRAMADDDKLAQELVQYVPKSVTEGAACNKCVNWIEPNACKIVAGTINPAGWCVAFAPKEG